MLIAISEQPHSTNTIKYKSFRVSLNLVLASNNNDGGNILATSISRYRKVPIHT